jgi:hypothetical protein
LCRPATVDRQHSAGDERIFKQRGEAAATSSDVPMRPTGCCEASQSRWGLFSVRVLTNCPTIGVSIAPGFQHTIPENDFDLIPISRRLSF